MVPVKRGLETRHKLSSSHLTLVLGHQISNYLNRAYLSTLAKSAREKTRLLDELNSLLQMRAMILH